MWTNLKVQSIKATGSFDLAKMINEAIANSRECDVIDVKIISETTAFLFCGTLAQATVHISDEKIW